MNSLLLLRTFKMSENKVYNSDLFLLGNKWDLNYLEDILKKEKSLCYYRISLLTSCDKRYYKFRDRPLLVTLVWNCQCMYEKANLIIRT